MSEQSLIEQLKEKGRVITDLRNKLKLTRAEADGKGSVMLDMQQAAIAEKLRADKLQKELDVAKAQLEIVTGMRDGYEKQWHAQKAEANKLRIRLADWQDTHNQIMEEKCAGDEKHCTCVPSLRVEIKRLTAEIEELEEEIDNLGDEVGRLDAENDDLRSELDALRSELP
jgi:chromosome segregation ATPase